jgi:hypothetical protein
LQKPFLQGHQDLLPGSSFCLSSDCGGPSSVIQAVALGD